MKNRHSGIAIKIELEKLFKRKDTWLLFTMLLIPIIYAFGLANHSSIVSYTGDGNIDAVNFVVMMFLMMNSMLIFNIILAANTSKGLSSEIENRSLLLYLNRIGSRKSVYIGKVIATTVFLIIASNAFVLISFILYYTVLSSRSDIVNGLLFNNQNVSCMIMQFISILAFMIISIRFVFMLSVFFKLVTTVIIYMVTYVLMDLLSYVKYVQYLTPNYYVKQFEMVSSVDAKQVVGMFVYLIVTILILDGIGMYCLERKDL